VSDDVAASALSVLDPDLVVGNTRVYHWRRPQYRIMSFGKKTTKKGNEKKEENVKKGGKTR
jgi:hypothetical protein